MPAGPGNFVTKVHRKGGGDYPAKVREADLSHAVQWHQDVQLPFIATHPGAGAEERVDKQWDWPTILVRCGMLEAILSDRSCAFVQLVCPGRNEEAVPVGQVLLVNNFPFIQDRSKGSVFTWYLTAMPEEALRHFGVPADLKLLRPLVDIALQLSFLLGHDGRIGLHADRHGSEVARSLLALKYRAVGLLQVRRSLRRWLVSPARPNDGRYFVADEAAALKLTTLLDPQR